MRLFSAAVLFCLLAAVPAFAAVYNADPVSHYLSRRSAELEWNGDATGYDLEVQSHERFARGLSPGLTKDLKAVFNIENFLSITQKCIKVGVKIVQMLSSVVSAKTIRESIEHLGFPGAGALGVLVEEWLNFVNELVTQMSKSEFLVGKPTKQNFVKFLSDSVVLVLKNWIRFFGQMEKTAEKVFAESGDVKYDVLDHVQINHPMAKQAFVTGHKVIKQIAHGIQSISSSTPRETITGFVKSAPLPHAKELAEIIHGILLTTNEVCTEILDTKFLKEEASIKNVNRFIVIVIKSITIKALHRTVEVLKIILKAVLKAKGLPTDVHFAEPKGLDLPQGIAIRFMNKMLSFVVKVNAEKVLKIMHKSVSLVGKLIYETTSDPGVKAIPSIIKTVGKELTEFSANAAQFLIEHIHDAALATTKSKFVNESPSWENLKIFVIEAAKRCIKFQIEVTNKIKKYFDNTISKAIKVPSLVKEILGALIPPEILISIQKVLKSINRGVQAVTGPLPVGAIRGFIKSSGLPFAAKLAEIVGKIMTCINSKATFLAKSKFFTETPTVENAALSFTELLKESISSGLQVFSEILEIILSVF